MKSLICTAAAFSLLLAATVPATQEQVTRRIPQFENEHVEVWKSVIVPNQPLTMHRHDNPRAIIALRGGTLRVVSDSGESHEVVWETGNAYWLEADPPGELHGDVNPGPEPVEVIVVQLKGATPGALGAALEAWGSQPGARALPDEATDASPRALVASPDLREGR